MQTIKPTLYKVNYLVCGSCGSDTLVLDNWNRVHCSHCGIVYNESTEEQRKLILSMQIKRAFSNKGTLKYLIEINKETSNL